MIYANILVLKQIDGEKLLQVITFIVKLFELVFDQCLIYIFAIIAVVSLSIDVPQVTFFHCLCH